MKCARCGRHLDRLEGRIGDDYYCHPDDPKLPDCYEIACHEQTRQNRTVHITEDVIQRELDRWHSLLEELRRLGD